jgi:hypothetical protein
LAHGDLETIRDDLVPEIIHGLNPALTIRTAKLAG